MTFAVTYRNKSGQRETLYIDAADRSECFRILNDRQIRAISVNACEKKPAVSKHAFSNRSAKVFLAGVIILVAVLLSVLHLNSSSKQPPNDSKNEKSTISVASTKKRSASSSEISPKQELSTPPDGIIEAEVSHTNTPRQTTSSPKKFRIVKNNKKKIFHTVSDVYISRILNTRPGHAVIGTMNYDRFEEQFKKSLATPIIINDDDSPSEVAMKQAVIETRKELKAAMDRGEDIAQLMRDSENELRKLYNYRQTLSAELSKAMRERKYSADDMQCYIDAANKMLSDNGMPPLKHPQLWIRQLKLEQAERSSKE